MFTSKERSHLISLASTLAPVGQIGKQGITDALILSFAQALEKREIIKITVLANAQASAKELAPELAQSLGAQVVNCIGKKIVLYKKSTKDNVKHIEF